MARRIWPRMSLGIGWQANLTTVAAGFTYFEAELAAPPERVRKIQDFNPAVSQVGGNPPRLPGSKHGGTFTLRFPMRTTSKANYDGGAGGGGADIMGTTDGVLAMELLLVGNAWGSLGNAAVLAHADFTKGKHLSVSAGLPNDVAAASTTTTIKVADATVYKEGQLFVAMTGTSDANPCVGWIKTATMGTDVVLAEAIETAEIPVNLDETYDTAVAFPAEVDRVPLTLRVLGNNAAFKGDYIGITCTETRHDLGAGDLWWTEMDFVYTDRIDYDAGGGLEAPDSFYPAPALLGDDGGRMLYGAAGATTEASALGWRDMQLKVSWPVHDVLDINAPEGVGEMVHTMPEITLAAKVPVSSADSITNGEDPYETILTTEARRVFQFASGQAAGQMCSIFLGGMQLKEAPKRVLVDMVEYYDCVWETGARTLDTGTDLPANTLCRLGVA